jgi:hypothetical protein
MIKYEKMREEPRARRGFNLITRNKGAGMKIYIKIPSKFIARLEN